MEKIIVNGGKKLKGRTYVSGAKNVALKAMVAACLTSEEVVIRNVPLISDFMVMAEIIKELGGEVKIIDHVAYVHMKNFKKEKISLEEAAKIRASAMFLSPLLARMGKAIIPNPGGCRIGARPIDRTIKGLEKMGYSVSYMSNDGFFYLKKNNNLKKEYYTLGMFVCRYLCTEHQGRGCSTHRSWGLEELVRSNPDNLEEKVFHQACFV